MRFTSLIVELIRARPRLVVWIVVLVQAGLWLLLPLLLYSGPPGDVATVLAYGREYQVGSWLGPPLAFWLGDIAFRLAGHHMFGVYLLAQLCFVVTFQALYALSRAIVGPQQAVIAVLLTMTVTAFSWPGVEFGPLVLARPLWALLLLHFWQIIGQGRRAAWFALSIEAGLLLLTTTAAPVLLLLPIGFALANRRSRRALMSFDPFYALVVIAVLVLPYAIWLIRAELFTPPQLPATAELAPRALRWLELLGGLLFATTAVWLLTAMNSRWFSRGAGDAPIIYRPRVDPFAQQFVYSFALAPALAGSLLAAAFGLEQVVGGAGIALLLSGLAVVVASSDRMPLRRQRILRTAWAAAIAAPALVAVLAIGMQPWIAGKALPTALPAHDIARFFAENFERRTNRPLPAVAGDPQLAALIGMAPSRPHVMLDATPERTPWVTPARFAETGGVVVWRATDTVGKPPEDIAQRFPDLVPELPRAFARIVEGRQSPLRIGWGIIRPKQP